MSTSQDLLDRARAVAEAARQRGAQGARVSVRRSRKGEVEWRDGKLDRLREATEVSLGITLFVDGRYSANSTSDLRPEAVARLLDETTAATRLLAPDAHRKLAPPARYAGRFAGELGIWDEAGAAATSGAERRRLAQALEQAARSGPEAAEIISVTAGAGDEAAEAAMVCSNGMEGTVRSSSFSLWAETTVRDRGDRKPEGWWQAVTRERGKLPGVEQVGREATRRALADRGAKPEKSGKYPCVIEAFVAGRLLGDLLGPLGGQAIQQKRSFLADKLGKKIAGEALTITDDPWLVGGLGSRPYDPEGMSTQRRPLVERGVLRSFLLDTYYASKLGQEPTTGATTNLVFASGKRDLAALLAAMGKGILVTGFSGGNANAATGDFSIGIRGQWIEGGKPVRALAEMNLAGNHLDLWSRLLEPGADPYPYAALRCPSLRFGPVQFSGS
ncbi:MAG: TldD/PmbA family protein [Deltaproteobacteria bacterium]|nr:TldD/PmbA family protein [Deltaproteobacteria bacterium]